MATVRMQVYVAQSDHFVLKRIAKRSGHSVASLVREGIRMLIDSRYRKP